jgi:predicted chitinase
MASIGTNVGWAPGAARLKLIDSVPGLRAVRFPVRLESNDLGFIQELLKRNILPWLVLDKDALGSNMPRSLAVYAQRYADQGVVWEVGNEPDITSPSSWTMTQTSFTALLNLARNVLGPDAYLVAGGLASGQPDWLNGVDLQTVNAVALHPYGKWPSDTPVNVGWGFGPVLPLLRAYRDNLDRRGWKRIALHVTEYGAPYNELGGKYPGYIRDMTRVLAESPLLGYALQFCLTDQDVNQFGLFDAGDGRRADLAIPELAPVVVPQPLPTTPDPWQWFTAEQIAGAAQVPLEKVRNNWPVIVRQLDLVGLNDRATQIAAIGTVAIETASTFESIHEYGTPADWARYSGGPNYAGRGFIQLTHDYNYREYGEKVRALWGAGPDDPTFYLAQHPDNALDPDIAAAVLATYFRDHTTVQGYSISQAANAGDWEWVRRLVQGGTAGLDRLVQIATALSAIPVPEPPPVVDLCAEWQARAERAEALLAQLRELLAA